MYQFLGFELLRCILAVSDVTIHIMSYVVQVLCLVEAPSM